MSPCGAVRDREARDTGAERCVAVRNGAEGAKITEYSVQSLAIQSWQLELARGTERGEEGARAGHGNKEFPASTDVLVLYCI